MVPKHWPNNFCNTNKGTVVWCIKKGSFNSNVNINFKVLSGSELNIKPQRTKLPSSTDASCPSVVRSSVVSKKEILRPTLTGQRHRDLPLHHRWSTTRGFSQLLFNSLILLPPCFGTHPTAQCPDTSGCPLEAQPEDRALQPGKPLEKFP